MVLLGYAISSGQSEAIQQNAFPQWLDTGVI